MRKFRADFVTNSSSSSFVIARKQECTQEEIKNAIMEYASEIMELIKEFDELEEYKDYSFDEDEDDYDDDFDEEDYDDACDSDDKDDSSSKIVEKFADELSENLMRKSGMELGDWIVSPDSYSNDSDAKGCFMFEHGNKLETPNFRVANEW